MGHCRQLCIENVTSESLWRLLECASQPAPILEWLRINGLNSPQFPGPLFSSFAPCLRVLAIHRLEFDTVQIPHYLPTCKAVTHLCLKAVYITNTESYTSFRHVLGEMKSLSHLELQPSYFPITLPPQSPLELPNLRFLLVDCSRYPGPLRTILYNILAPSLTSLSVSGWYQEHDAPLARSHFPSLRHLIIPSTVREVHLLAQVFPDIKYLTYGKGSSTQSHIVYNLLDAINNCVTPAWLELEIIAVPRMYSSVHVDLTLRDAVSNLQQAGRPFRMLMLSHHYMSETSTEALAQLREIVDIETFREDWPRPFEAMF